MHSERASPIVADINEMGKGKGVGCVFWKERRREEKKGGYGEKERENGAWIYKIIVSKGENESFTNKLM